MTDYVRGLDAATILTPYAKTIAERGFKAVGRYLKSLTKAELEALHEAGLSVWPIYETTANRALGGAAAGREDGAHALAQLNALGAPQDVVPYATVDTDPSPSQILAIHSYFIEFANATGRKIGAYACGAVLSDLGRLNSAPIPWLAGAMGWNGSHAYDATNAWAMKQGPQINAARTAHWCNLDWPSLPFAYDPNVIARDIGGWYPAAATISAKPRASSPPTTISPAPASPASLAPSSPVADILAAPSFTEAVKTYQASHGLTADGVIGRQTLTRIVKELIS